MTIAIPSHLSDDELVAEVHRCAHRQRAATAHLIAHLVEFDARRLHLAAGYSSLFAYCCDVLGFSEHEAYNRIEAARMARRFPMVLERLADGRLNLTTARLLAPHLTEGNHGELLSAGSRRSKRELEELLARRFPRPDVPASVRKVPERAPKAATVDGPSIGEIPGSGLADTRFPSPEPMQPPAPAVRRAVVQPLSTDRYEIRFTASAGMRDKLKQAQDLLRHAIPTGDPAAIFDRGLTALLDELARRKLSVVRKPLRTARSTGPGSRHIPSEVKRSVWARDGGRCAFVAASGHRCAERAFLEFHHVEPYAAGGAASTPNIQLRCRAHNRYEADLFFGGRDDYGPSIVNEVSEPRCFLGFSTRSGTSWVRSGA